jgi:uroporphyrinogen decarboxylase
MTFLNALKGKNYSGLPPIWLMRQAGRSLPAFRNIRKEYSFQKCVFTPEIATEITLLPEKELGVDALVLFSDILVIYEKFLGKVTFPGGKPYAECSFEEEIGIDVFDPIFETIRRVKEKSSLPVIGFAGAPFTVLSYLKNKPKEDHKLLEKIAIATREYIEKQIEAGASAIQIFDSWAAADGLENMRKISFPYVKEIIRDLPVPTIFFCRNSSLYAKEIAREVRPDGISVDSKRSLKEVRDEVGPDIVLQGNLDPEILLLDQQSIEKAVRAILEDRKDDPAFIFNLGHGVLPNTPVDNVKLLISLVKRIDRNVNTPI